MPKFNKVIIIISLITNNLSSAQENSQNIKFWWGIVVQFVGLINEVNQRWAPLVQK